MTKRVELGSVPVPALVACAAQEEERHQDLRWFMGMVGITTKSVG